MFLMKTVIKRMPDAMYRWMNYLVHNHAYLEKMVLLPYYSIVFET